MKLYALILLTITPTYLCENITELFEIINQEYLNYGAKLANTIWESTGDSDNQEVTDKNMKYINEIVKWRMKVCEKLLLLQRSDHTMNSSQSRQTYLLCREPHYNFDEASFFRRTFKDIEDRYTKAKICIPASEKIEIDNIQQVEIAILKYVTKVKNFKNEHGIDSKVDDDFVSLNATIANGNKETGFCLNGMQDFGKVMELSKNETVLRWVWLVWWEKVGPLMKEQYRRLVDIENDAARRNGYQNIGESWQNEFEIPHLRQRCSHLYKDIKPLYTVLHGVVRFYLRRFYGDVVPERGPIPAHLLGNLWSHSWESLFNLISPKTIDLNQSIRNLNWTHLDIVRESKDFYQSFRLPAMNYTIRRYDDEDTLCHSRVMDMCKDGDFRFIYCPGTALEDLYTFHHAQGYFQYFMAYENQPALFRDANAVLFESLGKAVMNGVLTPQHLHRLGLVNDSLLYVFDENRESMLTTVFDDNDDTKANNDGTNDAENNDDHNGYKIKDELTKEIFVGYFNKNTKKNPKRRDNHRGSNKFGDNENQTDDLARKFLNYANMENNNSNDFDKEKDNFIDTFDELFTTDDILLLRQALDELPRIPYLLLLDEYKWKYCEGSISMWDQNREFWIMATELQGIAPSNDRGEDYFDIGAKVFVSGERPHIRQFLSSFLQHQLFENLCKAAVYGRRTRQDLPDTITLNRCDIYGSKTVGYILKDLMSLGNSQHWWDILEQETGESEISAESLLRYYRPLYEKLLELVRRYEIPLGWKEVRKSGWYFA